MDKFYYDLLNIGQNNLDKEKYFKIIKEVIEAEAEIYRDDNPNLERLCKFVSTNINSNLTDKRISSKIVNTKELYDMYEHQFVISSFVDNNEINYILIDPTFTQFRPRPNDLDCVSPIGILLESKEGTKLCIDLVRHGYSKINDDDLKRYIASIMLEKDISKIDVTIDDIILERRHK